jgi:CheY-like chemotaxis protein
VGARVLVVEDDEAIAFMYALALRQAGWAVEVAMDGETALEAIRRDRPAAVVLDMALPRLNGAGLLEAVRGDPLTADVPVVVLSNADVDEWRATARRLGTPWLVKSRNTPAAVARRLLDDLGAPDERRRQPRRLEDVLRLLQSMTLNSGVELPIGVAAVLYARGIDLASATSLDTLRLSVAKALPDGPLRERRSTDRRGR